jgi:hypothetical protein
MKISNYVNTSIVVSVINEKTNFKKRYFYNNISLLQARNMVKKSSLKSNNIFFVYCRCSSDYVYKIYKGKVQSLYKKKSFRVSNFK